MTITVKAFKKYLDLLLTLTVSLNAISNQKQTTQREIEEAEDVYGKAESVFQRATQLAVAIHRVYRRSTGSVGITEAWHYAMDAARKHAELAQLAFEKLHKLKHHMNMLVTDEFMNAFDLEFALLDVDHYRHDPRFTGLVEKGTDEKANAVINIARSAAYVEKISKYEDIMNNSMFHINQFDKLMSIYDDSRTKSAPD
jgi:hypothetical protein